MNELRKCPCHSGESYEKCCGRYHKGELPTTPTALMRSRYSAYATENIDYILSTTHPENPDAKVPLEERREQIEAFCKHTDFVGLEILNESESNPYAYVTFHAHLKQGTQDVSFKEKSEFEKIKDKWLYRKGKKIS